MESKVNYTFVGLFVIVLTVGIVAIAAWLTAATDSREYDYYRVYVRESVAGLNVNASVKYKGVDVGQVTSIGLAPNNPDRVELILRIEEDTPIRERTLAKLVSQGITGLVYVELSGGGASPPLTAEDEEDLPIIKSGPSLVARAEEAFNNLYLRLDDLLSQRNLNAVGETLASIQTLAEVAASRSDDIDKTLANLQTISSMLASSADTFEQTLQSGAKITADLNTQLEPLVKQANATLAALKATAEAFTGIGEDVAVFVDESRREINQLSRQTTPELNKLLSNLDRLAATLAGFVRTLEREPSQLLFGGSNRTPGPGE
jgi:phospholipid/cholesterol/gamma-HCH transport system substrate-binding protein